LSEAAKIPIIVVNCAESPKPNVALLRLDMRSALPIAQVPIPISVRLKNESNIEQNRRIEVYVDGVQQYAGSDVAMAPGAEERHDFTIVFDRGGLHKGEVRLVGSDGNKYDDKLFFALEVDQGIPVALVKGAKHEVAFLEDTFYLQSALSTGSGGISPIRLTTLTPEELAGEPLANYAAVFCVNMPAPDQDTAERLATYVERGGNLIWAAGDNMYAEPYNALNDQFQGKLLPAPIKQIQSPDFADGRESWSIGMLDEQYPPFRNLLRPRELYTSVLVYKRIPFDLSVASAVPVPVLARLDDGEPFILQNRVGQGTVTMLGANVHVSWTNLPLKHIFVPMINQMVFQLAGIEQTRLQTTAGNPLTFTFKEDETPTTVEIIPPTGAVERHELAKLAGVKTVDGKTRQFMYDGTYQIGVYLLRPLDIRRQMQIPFSVNIDPNEIDAAVMDEAGFKKMFADTPLVFTKPGDAMDSTFDQLKSGTGLWDFFLVLVLIGLVVESFVSNRLTTKKSEQEKGIDARRSLPPKPVVLGA
ncbi:MAG TPA: hypothetical protein DEB39_00595, partial [Planctomycetaceae bacterium]|nr:hypothetical protein [Planctomycetaceae bacterium]